jgi:hypothetical protein
MHTLEIFTRNILKHNKSIMKTTFLSLFLALGIVQLIFAQSNPAITTWMINTTGVTGAHYINGNPTPIPDTAQVNVQKVQYSDNYTYINCSGIPAYIIGPYLDGNPALATNNDHLFRIPLNPEAQSGSNVSTPMGPTGIFINGVPIYNYADGASYNSSTGNDNMMGGDGVWNRNAILAENAGFDCAKGHPSPIFNGPPGPGGSLAGGTYHHHQNPTAFNMDLVELSDVCDVYLADGLYTLDAAEHSPLIGFAFDGFPVYGGYGFANTDGTGGIARMRSSYQVRDISERTQYADGTSVTEGPAVSVNFPLGWYKEDFEYIPFSGHLDFHNGRFCVTPEYPEGTYAYFATVDENWNSAYPYIIGPSYYGDVASENFNNGPNGNSVTINEAVTLYEVSSNTSQIVDPTSIFIGPNPVSDLLLIQVKGLLQTDLRIRLIDLSGRVLQEKSMPEGSTLLHLETELLYSGEYILEMSDGYTIQTRKVVVMH